MQTASCCKRNYNLLLRAIKLYGKNRYGKSIEFYFPFYIMDYATCDLKKYLENNQISYAERIHLCLQIAEGLKELNDLGCYHRDLKPDNILMFDNIWK